MKNKDIVVIAIVALVAAFVGGFAAGLVGDNQFGAGTRMPNGISADSTAPVAGEVRSTTLTVTGAAALQSTATITGDLTLNGGSGALVITTTNAATSTLAVGCIQKYATSTATPIKEMLFATSSISIDGGAVTAGFGGGTAAGFVLWGFGTCP